MKEDAPFILVALAFHGLLLVVDPGILWQAAKKAPEKLLEVGFVTVPPVGIAQSRAPLAAGIAPGGDSSEPEAASPAAPAPVKAKTIKKAFKKPLSPEQIARRQERARVKAERRAAQARARAERELAQAQIREINRRLEAARRQAAELARREALEAQARARQERIRMIAEARARETARKAEISRTLAELPSPDEALSAAQPEAGGGKVGRGAGAPSQDLGAAGLMDAGQDLRDAPNAGGGNGRVASGAGVELEIEGSAAGRRLLNRPTPGCPEWVSRRGLELAVAVRFVVMDSGAVKEGILVTQTSGFPDLDKLVLAAVRKWKFEKLAALSGRGKLEQWGLVTFKFVG